jgi:hypothetical protein
LYIALVSYLGGNVQETPRVCLFIDPYSSSAIYWKTSNAAQQQVLSPQPNDAVSKQLETPHASTELEIQRATI